MTFSSWTSTDAVSVPPCTSLSSVDTGLSLPAGVCELGMGESTDEGASTVLLLVLEGDASK